MSPIHSISEELQTVFRKALRHQNNWIAYNANSFHLGKGDVLFFKDKSEAIEFAAGNYSDNDFYKIIYGNSESEIAEALLNGRSLTMGADVSNNSDLPKNAIITSGAHVGDQDSELQHFYNTKNNNTMNQKNFDYLKDQVKFTGFGEGLENDLKERMQKQSPQFLLSHEGNFGKDETISTLHFRKSDQSDMYFFNKYDLTVQQENKPGAMTQTFYINKGNNITLKEAYNLMNGRSVNKDLTNKEGQVYNAWVQMDFKQADNNGNYKLKQFHQNYGYDLKKALSKLPIKELLDENDKNALLNSLQKGNRQAVTFLEDKNERRQYIEANPQFKSITIYDANMNRLGSRQNKGEKQAQGESQSAKAQNKKAEKEGPDIAKQAQKKSKRKSQAIA